MKKEKSKSEERREKIQAEEKPAFVMKVKKSDGIQEEEKKEEPKKKKEIPYEEKLVAQLKKLPFEVLSAKEIMADLIQDVYKGYRRNQIVNLYLQGKFLENKNDASIAQTLAQVQAEIKNQEVYLEYLFGRISS